MKEVAHDRYCTAWSIWLTAASTGLAFFYCLFLFGHLHHHPGRWYPPPDARQVTGPANDLLGGHLHAVYSSNRLLYSLPLSFVVVAPAAAVVRVLHLPGEPHQMWLLVVLPYFVACGGLTLQAARRLAWDLGMQSRLWLVQVAAVFVVLLPEVEWGHVEDTLALACVISMLRRLIRGDFTRAALYVGVAISFKQWAIMLIPLLVLTTPSRERARVFVLACALPVALAVVFLSVDFKHVFEALTSPVTQSLGFPGHPWIAPTWLGAHTSQVNRALAAGLAFAVAWRGRHRSRQPVELVGAAAVILLIRPLFESINYSYYWSPALLLLVVVAGGSSGRLGVGDWCLPVVAMAWTVPRSDGLAAPAWWAGELLLLALVVWRVAPSCGFGPGRFVRRRGLATASG